MSGSFLQDALIYLATAAIFVPIARKLGLGSILGYLLGGILIGRSFWALSAKKERTLCTLPNSAW
jgi:Kef-type K+ transport system membrane component KefB